MRSTLFNDLGAERLIPLEYHQQEDVFTTVSGVFDSNPGKTQRQTPWRYSWTEDEIEEEVRNCMKESKLVEVEERHLKQFNRSFRMKPGLTTYRALKKLLKES